MVCLRADKASHAPWIEPIGGLIEDEKARPTQQRSGQSEALTHAQRVRADPVRSAGSQPDAATTCHSPPRTHVLTALSWVPPAAPPSSSTICRLTPCSTAPMNEAASAAEALGAKLAGGKMRDVNTLATPGHEGSLRVSVCHSYQVCR